MTRGHKMRLRRNRAQSLGCHDRHPLPRVCLREPGSWDVINWQWRYVIRAQMICYRNNRYLHDVLKCLLVLIRSEVIWKNYHVHCITSISLWYTPFHGIMAWRRIGDNPLSEPILTRFTDAYIWGTRGKWANESTTHQSAAFLALCESNTPATKGFSLICS